VRVLTSQDLERVLSFPVCIDEMQRAMIATSERRCVLPLRQFMPVPDRAGKLGLMPGYLGGDDECFGVKVVSKFERAAGDPHGSHVGAVLLFDAETGLLQALLEGGTLTAIRTASVTALATATLARASARRLLIVGAGEEAWYHGRALLHARPFETVDIWARDPARAAVLAARLQDWRSADAKNEIPTPRFSAVHDLQAACRAADVICTVTSAKTPLVHGDWFSEGVHVNLVGSAIPTTAEVDSAAVARAMFFVDYREAALAAAGELLAAIREGVVGESHIIGELGEVLAGKRPGRVNDSNITIYKSLGVTTQDLAAGWRAARDAARLGIGQTLDLTGLA
jgi:ornithine cyclodeaminase/alanine dehydrogenase-like protein (mu-crystallin family)